MRAVLVDEARTLVWTEVPDPVPKAGELLVDVHAAALNRADLLQREGNYPPPPGWPEWMGLEAAGVMGFGEVLQDVGARGPVPHQWLGRPVVRVGHPACGALGGSDPGGPEEELRQGPSPCRIRYDHLLHGVGQPGEAILECVRRDPPPRRRGRARCRW